MYSDFLDHLGSGGAGGSSSSGGNNSNNNSNEHSVVSFKAGKVKMTLQENGNYWAEPDTGRGEIRLVWKTSDSNLHYQWYDRREKQVSDTRVINNSWGTVERVTNVPPHLVNPSDRLYVWTQKATEIDEHPDYQMFWMQDATDEQDDEVVAKFNQYLADPASANPNAAAAATGGSTSTNNTDQNNDAEGNNNSSSGSSSSSSATASNEAAAAPTTATGRTTAGSTKKNASTSTDRQQVDALSNILENLGMPQNNPPTEGAATATTAAAAGGGGALTLADLQGAMAGLASQSQPTPGPPLQELVTPGSISALLENEAVSQRLLQFLPEEQRSREYLEENLRSPQVQQTLRSLTSALLPDDNGSLDGYHSILANFSLEGAQEALVQGNHNPIQAFLDCILKSVEKEQKEEEEKEEKA